MLCYRCGSHVPDSSESCGNCGQRLGGGPRQTTGTFSRRKLGQLSVEGAPFKPGERVLERYLVKDTIGTGPAGFVFRARDEEMDVEVAFKAVNPRLLQTQEERRDFFAALKPSRGFTHPNLVRTYEHGEASGWPFYTMPFLEGLSLRKIIDLRLGKAQFFSLKEVEPIVAQIASALEAANKAGPHGNVKPENVIILPDLLKVSDFGLAAAVPRPPFVQAAKARRASAYLAPEYVQGEEFDERVDVFALAVILGEMLGGPIPESGVVELVRINPELPLQIEGLYRRALNASPHARPKTAMDFFEELSELTRRVSPPPIAKRPEPAVSRSRVFAPASEEIVARYREEEVPPPPDLLAEETPSLPVLRPEDRTVRVRAVDLPPEAFRDEKSPRGFRAIPPPPPEEATARSVSFLGRSGSWLFGLLVLGGVVVGVAGGYAIWEGWRPSTVRPIPAVPPPPAVEPTRPVEEPQAASVPEDQAVAEAEALAAKEAEAAETQFTQAPRPISADEKSKPDPAAEDRKGGRMAPAAVQPGCPEGMRYVPAGPFRMGTAKEDPMMGFDERSLYTVDLGAFCIDQYEFPNRKGTTPSVNISWADAKRLCEGKGKRLCSEEEWEKACKGPANARFPYGEVFDADSCNTQSDTGDDRSLDRIGAFGRCRSGYGVWDLAGNVAEWTATSYAGGGDKAQKGGSFDRPDFASRCAARKNGVPGARAADVGFRCCQDLPDAE